MLSKPSIWKLPFNRMFISILAAAGVSMALFLIIKVSNKSVRTVPNGINIQQQQPINQTTAIPAPVAPSTSPSPTPVQKTIEPVISIQPTAPESNVQAPTVTRPALILKPKGVAVDPITADVLGVLTPAIIEQESSGNSQLQHPVSKAVGLGQILPKNIEVWSKEIFGQEVTLDQFLNNPDIQAYVIKYKLLEYYYQAMQETGGDLYLTVKRVAAKWYSGDPNLYLSDKKVSNGPTVRKYADSVLTKFRKTYPDNLSFNYNPPKPNRRLEDVPLAPVDKGKDLKAKQKN